MSDRTFANRLGAASGAAFVVLLFSAAGTGSESVTALTIELIALVLFLPFLAYLYTVLRQAEGDHGWLATTLLTAGLVGLTIKIVSGGPAWVARAIDLDPPLRAALEHLNNVAFIVAMLPLAVMMAATAVLVVRTRVLPTWLGWLAALTAPALLINGVMLDRDFGPAFLLFLLWILLASVTLVLPSATTRTRRGTPQTAR